VPGPSVLLKQFFFNKKKSLYGVLLRMRAFAPFWPAAADAALEGFGAALLAPAI
jgi:hypothetical protein